MTPIVSSATRSCCPLTNAVRCHEASPAPQPRIIASAQARSVMRQTCRARIEDVAVHHEARRGREAYGRRCVPCCRRSRAPRGESRGRSARSCVPGARSDRARQEVEMAAFPGREIHRFEAQRNVGDRAREQHGEGAERHALVVADRRRPRRGGTRRARSDVPPIAGAHRGARSSRVAVTGPGRGSRSRARRIVHDDAGSRRRSRRVHVVHHEQMRGRRCRACRPCAIVAHDVREERAPGRRACSRSSARCCSSCRPRSGRKSGRLRRRARPVRSAREARGTGCRRRRTRRRSRPGAPRTRPRPRPSPARSGVTRTIRASPTMSSKRRGAIGRGGGCCPRSG